jgi:PII-like signaling protein
LPILIVAVDLKKRIEKVIPKVNQMLEGRGLVSVERVDVVSPMPSLVGQRAEEAAI